MNLAGIDITELVAIGVLLVILFVGLVWLSMRVNALEEQLDAMPTHADLRRIETQLGAVAGHIKGLDERTAASAHMLASIHQHLLGENSHG